MSETIDILPGGLVYPFVDNCPIMEQPTLLPHGLEQVSVTDNNPNLGGIQVLLADNEEYFVFSHHLVSRLPSEITWDQLVDLLQ